MRIVASHAVAKSTARLMRAIGTPNAFRCLETIIKKTKLRLNLFPVRDILRYAG